MYVEPAAEPVAADESNADTETYHWQETIAMRKIDLRTSAPAGRPDTVDAAAHS